jgi:hypothetical protein
MTLGDTLISIRQQVLTEGKSRVDLGDKTYSVGSTHAKKLRIVHFDYIDHRLDGIEQNPATTSQWAALAREGTRIMQFSVSGKRDTCRNPRPGMHGRSGYQLLLGFWDFQLSGNKEWISPIFIDGKRESTSVR